jgi:ABC-2 type transport system ATP-binding protein
VPVIEVENLRKVFKRGFFRRRTTAVDGVSFEVEQGEVFGFLGPNGAGKTTTMKVLMGLIHPTAGTAKVLGAPVGDRKAKARLGYLPEHPYFYDYLSALELLNMVGRLQGLDRSARNKRAHELLDRLGLAHAKTKALRSYSKGMLQRAGLAQALMGDPELVVLDEPMSGLDPIGRKDVRDLIMELREQGKTVFFCTHVLADANLLCDRVGIIVRGTLRDVGPLGDLLSPKVYAVDVLWSCDSPELREQIRARVDAEHETTSEGEHSRCAGQAQADELISKIVGGGARIIQVVPQRQTLEQLFVKDAAEHPDERSEEAS